ncbi:nucleotidyltransferase [Bacillus salipaludis]|uniref:Cyclic GMP-AMP synthase n=1 Tax=Bacillus salipaludis TaxID=2547811 RepID=A0A4R5VLN5_9BACI|nr:nucleotidyltransferase [Bacillus salipaludis]TDK58117.1 nucleotidyltransferase [Bacillus salipaludis]
MADIQKFFLDFHEAIKLKRFKENKELREKRDIIINKIKDGLNKKFENSENCVPNVEFIDQGSYAVDLGIIPEDKDYDIDEGVIFDLYIEDYQDCVELKKWIRDILQNHTSTLPKIKNPCVTVTYSLDEEPVYHVDLPVYAKSKNDDKLYLAWGKEFSNLENKYWNPADPEGLNDFISNSFSEDDKKQFKRIVRFIKKWKDICFSSEGNKRPPSIGITITAADMFSPNKTYIALTDKYEYNDLAALKNYIQSLKSKFSLKWDQDKNQFLYIIEYNLPVEPYKNVFSKMSNVQMNEFYNKLDDLYNGLSSAEQKDDPYEACKILVPFFGEKFPVPESKEARFQKVALSSAPSSHSALKG